MADTDWNLHSKQLITPADDSRMLLEPSDETAKAVEVGGFRTWLMNTALFNTLTTTAKNIIGAIEEVKGIADNNTTQLNDITKLVNNINSSQSKYVTRDSTLGGTQEIAFDYLPKKFIIIASLEGKMSIGILDENTSMCITNLTTSFTFDFTHSIIFYTAGVDSGTHAIISRENNKLVINWSKFGTDVTGNIQMAFLGI